MTVSFQPSLTKKNTVCYSTIITNCNVTVTIITIYFYFTIVTIILPLTLSKLLSYLLHSYSNDNLMENFLRLDFFLKFFFLELKRSEHEKKPDFKLSGSEAPFLQLCNTDFSAAAMIDRTSISVLENNAVPSVSFHCGMKPLVQLAKESRIFRGF
ncbi:hypothetical protein Y032_0116g556 [Ancylostoma ceylanicum]|uniref:Uncharacterized protein n=1 Tax=Ancylostoma ceylanicum TaxID=53326 RepID=A0A016TCA8_9BILA|nr:hypothetical protein Y032_0116g556 [Ancylostoma ceylanicum]